MTVVLKKFGQKLKLDFPEIRVNYQLSKRAEKNLGNIAVYSIQNFGIQQARIYRDGLLKPLAMICDFPMIGSDQNHIKKNVRRQVYESHPFIIVSGPKPFSSYVF